MLVEQAIFASGRSERSEGYHLVARSPALSEAIARELTHWGPSHDSLCSSGSDGVSINFFPLGHQTWCVSRTMAAGDEYSGRGGAHVYTHCLIVPAEVFDRFGRNPFAILRAAAGLGGLHTRQAASSTLEALRLTGRASSIDSMLLAQLAVKPGPAAMAGLLHRALSAERLIVAGEGSNQLLAGVFNLLPLAARGDFSFSTGLKLSGRRPFRASAVPTANADVLRFARQMNCEVMEVNSMGAVDWQGDAWAAVVETALRESKLNQLREAIERPTGAAVVQANTPAAPALDSELESILAAAALDAARATLDDFAAALDDVAATRDTAPGESPPLDHTRGRADAPHSRQNTNASAPPSGATATEFGHRRPSHVARPVHAELADDPDTIELLERLDDLVFDAIDGNRAAAAQLVEYWPQVSVALRPESLAESREQYLRFALSIWTQSDRDPERSLAALEVLCLLFPEADWQ